MFTFPYRAPLLGPQDLKTHIENLSIKEIKTQLKNRDIPQVGCKSDLVDRLMRNFDKRYVAAKEH